MRSSWTIPLAALLLPGCGDKPAPGPTAAAPQPPMAIPAPTPAPEVRGPVEAEAKVFLRAVAAGTAGPAALTPEFKKLIAPAKLPADAAKGYSDEFADSWLKKLKPNASAGSVSCPIATAEVGFVVAAAPNGGRTLLRLAKRGNDWLVDWYQDTPTAPLVPGGPAEADADEAGAWFAAAAFVESAGQGRFPHAESLLTDAAKAKLSPPLFDSDKARGYNPSKLPEEVARLVPAGSTIPAFKLEKAPGGFLGTGELKSPTGSKTLLLVLARGTGPGEWRVADAMAK